MLWQHAKKIFWQYGPPYWVCLHNVGAYTQTRRKRRKMTFPPSSHLNLGLGRVGCLRPNLRFFCSYLSHVTTQTIASNPLRMAVERSTLFTKVNNRINFLALLFEHQNCKSCTYITTSFTRKSRSCLPQTFYDIIFSSSNSFSPFHDTSTKKI